MCMSVVKGARRTFGANIQQQPKKRTKQKLHLITYSVTFFPTKRANRQRASKQTNTNNNNKRSRTTKHTFTKAKRKSGHCRIFFVLINDARAQIFADFIHLSISVFVSFGDCSLVSKRIVFSFNYRSKTS